MPQSDAALRRYECHPVCADLQAQILQCYRQNTQQTLSCSALASQYMRCVNQAKQGMVVVGKILPEITPFPVAVNFCPLFCNCALKVIATYFWSAALEPSTGEELPLRVTACRV
ncbi:hypothetical protein CB1_001038001 [Camelus ferus]|nr:hypothetical protein CB1_001038001 [Camelus ferus]